MRGINILYVNYHQSLISGPRLQVRLIYEDIRTCKKKGENDEKVTHHRCFCFKSSDCPDS